MKTIRHYGVSNAQGSRLIRAIRKYALECLDCDDLDSLYAFCEQFNEVMRSIEAGHEAEMQDLASGMYF